MGAGFMGEVGEAQALDRGGEGGRSIPHPQGFLDPQDGVVVKVISPTELLNGVCVCMHIRGGG